MAKITMNGVTYESVDAMPPDVRRMYDESMAKLPKLADRDGDGIPDIVQGKGLPVGHGSTVRTSFVVNGTTYKDLADMPPDVREAYERAMRAMSAGEPNVTRNEIKLSFQVGGSGFSLLKRSGSPSAVEPLRLVAGLESGSPPIESASASRPIEPGAAGGGLRLLFILGACVTAALLLWLFSQTG